MNIIIPMAGEGTRVKSTVPKPLVEVLPGKVMIEMALESLNIDGHYCFIVRRYNNQDWNVALRDAIRKTVGQAVVVEIDYLTDGPAISALHAPQLFFGETDLLVTNCDQIMHWDADKFIEFTKTTDAIGAVVTYETNTPKNSYALVANVEHKYPKFTMVKEKEVISNYSLNGIHWWKYGKDFASSVNTMRQVKDTVNGEYYIGPSYNYLDGTKRVYDITPSEHYAVGTLEDIERYRALYGNKKN
jgi:NDP-sugar pyrophosphorylase family protein